MRRRTHFREMLARKGGLGLAIDNHCAVAFVGAYYRVISAIAGAGAYALRAQGGSVNEHRLPVAEKYQPARGIY